MKYEEINEILGENIKILLNKNKEYTGYAREIVMPEEDDEIQEPILVLEMEGRKQDTIDGFYIKDILSVEIL